MSLAWLLSLFIDVSGTTLSPVTVRCFARGEVAAMTIWQRLPGRQPVPSMLSEPSEPPS